VAWWIAEKGSPAEFLGPTEVNQDAAKRNALARSVAKPGTVFQVRYRVNANGHPEVQWEALDGKITEITGDAVKHPR
jgi:hypothetical protein